MNWIRVFECVDQILWDCGVTNFHWLAPLLIWLFCLSDLFILFFNYCQKVHQLFLNVIICWTAWCHSCSAGNVYNLSLIWNCKLVSTGSKNWEDVIWIKFSGHLDLYLKIEVVTFHFLGQNICMEDSLVTNALSRKQKVERNLSLLFRVRDIKLPIPELQKQMLTLWICQIFY